ncbi:4 [Durusdinium trenchii]|uniref:4 n=1 Tax=Durusdinium trenchii TaxID=1381693 RepID=A0ABP0QAU9_9DINO
MQPADMSMVLAAFARMRYRDRDMMLRIAECTPAILGQFGANEITHYLAAFARLDVEHRLVFNLMAREIARKLHDFNAAQLGELVYAYARLKLRHQLLLDVLKKRMIEVIRAMRPWHLALIANGFARLNTSDERFFAILASEICRKIGEFEGKSLALVANAYARLGVRNRFLLELLGDEAFRRRGELEPQAIALLLNAHARLQMSNPLLFDYFAQDIPRRIRGHNLHSLCLISSAFAKARKSDEALFAKIGDYVCSHASELYPRALASFLFSFSEVDIRHGVLFYNAPDHVTENIKAYTTDELCMVGRAYGHFQMVHTLLFDSISTALPSHVLAEVEERQALLADAEEELDDEDTTPSSPLPKISSLIGLLEAYARLLIYHPGTLELLCDAIAAREPELVPALVVKVARACAALSFAHSGVLRLATQCMADQGQHLLEEDFDLLSAALEDLGVLSQDSRLMLATWWGKQDKVELRVFAGTWNLGNAAPPNDLRDWLPAGCDLYLVGVEECHYTPRPSHSTCLEDWCDLVQASLPSLLTICRHDMGHCQILFLATELVSKSIHSVVASHEETGLGGFYSNKGGLALSFWIGDQALCFVSSHLAAHQANVVQRNLDSAHIIEGICLTTDSQMPLTNQFHHVIWVGDLNYRLDLGREECLEMIYDHSWGKLQQHDQLLKVQAEGKAFCNFREGPLDFAPTYQHVPGAPPDPATRLRPYDPRKGRVPSWTDRVLWRSFPDAELMLEAGSYRSSPTLCTSDHSPVGAIFRMPVMRPYHLDDSESRILIRLSKLTATGLEAGDHHISFRAQFCDEDRHTSNATSKGGTLPPDPKILTGRANFRSVVMATKKGVSKVKWVQSRHILIAIYKVDDALESAHMKSHPISTVMALAGLADDFEDARVSKN